jgi:CO dehydrogenase maturation factor
MTMWTDEQRAARDAAVIDGLERRRAVAEEAAAAAAAAAEPLGWLGAQRQARSYLRNASTTPRARLSDGVLAASDSYVAALESIDRQADAALAAADPDAVADARARLGLRVAMIGKGGAGKTVISSTLSRTLARRGRKVFAADLDTCPGLAISLGLPLTDAGLPDEALEEAVGGMYGWQLARGISPEDAVDRFAAVAPDGVRFLGIGKIGSVEKDQARKSVAALLQILLGFSAPDWDVVADLEAGPTTPFERYHGFSEDVVVVVGPAWRSAMTARRLLPMVEARRTIVVANRFRDEPDHPGLAPAIRIPFDPDLTQAEREGLSPIDACPDSPAVAAIARLADLLLAGPPVENVANLG